LAKSGLSLIVGLGFLAGSVIIPGCSDPAPTVLGDPNAGKNKRVGRVEKVKGVPPGSTAKPEG
jgi:hypothetical protein